MPRRATPVILCVKHEEQGAFEQGAFILTKPHPWRVALTTPHRREQARASTAMWLAAPARQDSAQSGGGHGSRDLFSAPGRAFRRGGR